MENILIHFLHIYFWVYIIIVAIDVISVIINGADETKKSITFLTIMGLSIFILSCYY